MLESSTRSSTSSSARFSLVTTLLFVVVVAAGAHAYDYPILYIEEPLAGADVARGSRIVLLEVGGSSRVLTEGFADAADPCLSFDAKRLLFAARIDAGDPWNIWEMDVDGSKKRQLTRDLGDCHEPAYLPPAAVDSPNFRDKVRWMTFTSTAPQVSNDQADGVLSSLYATNLEPVPGRGTVLWRTTYNLGGDVSPTVMLDGRVLFSARQRGSLALMTISWAGENLNPLYGSHDGPISQSQAVELPDRTVVFIESESSSSRAAGRLARVSLRRPLHSHEVLSRDDGLYRTPHPLPDGRILVSYSDGSRSFGIYEFNPQKQRRGKKIHDDPTRHEIDAMAVVPRAVPNARIPTVEFASVLDVGSLKTAGQLQCLNVYESDRPKAEKIEKGQIHAVRLVEGLALAVGAEAPTTISTATPENIWPPPGVRTRVLGEATVESDGSFYVNVSGNVPFYMETLDAQGKTLQTMRAWTWVRTGDQRGCIGCHEDKEMGPENRATEALIRAQPATLVQPAASRDDSASQLED